MCGGGSPRAFVSLLYIIATHFFAVFATHVFATHVFAWFIRLLFYVGERASEKARSAGEGRGSCPPPRPRPSPPRPPPPARPSRRGVRRGKGVPWRRFGWRGPGAATRSGRSCRWRCDSCAARSPGGSP
ncbi:DUF6126 family protein [Streptomyces sp. NPDC094034]|uniref:DUF6126 family protein n=1 Tax=Streptomyces sp. NPDC094034 TaxID=3155309 RepID=UPI0033230BB0